MLGGRRKQEQFRDSDASSLGVCRDVPIEKARIGVEAWRGSRNKGPIHISGGRGYKGQWENDLGRLKSKYESCERHLCSSSVRCYVCLPRTEPGHRMRPSVG